MEKGGQLTEADQRRMEQYIIRLSVLQSDMYDMSDTLKGLLLEKEYDLMNWAAFYMDEPREKVEKVIKRLRDKK